MQLFRQGNLEALWVWSPSGNESGTVVNNRLDFTLWTPQDCVNILTIYRRRYRSFGALRLSPA